MQCPYCKGEMINGMLIADGRSRIQWQTTSDKRDLLDKMTSAKTYITNAEYSVTKYKITGDYCGSCNKIILNANLSE